MRMFRGSISEFPTTVLTVSGSVGMFSVLHNWQNTPIGCNIILHSVERTQGILIISHAEMKKHRKAGSKEMSC
jgi:hypothetical protein